MSSVISNVAGIVAVITWVFAIQNKNKDKVLKYQIIANTFYGIQYWLINALSSACMSLVSVIRTIVIYYFEKKNKNISIVILVLFSLIAIGFGYFTYDGIISLIPIIITLIYTYSVWQKDTKFIRFSVLFCAFLWVYYNINVGAYVALVGNALEIISGAISIIRFDIKKEKIGGVEDDIKKSKCNCWNK